jgi:outer membrane protein assembly factor BamB
MNLTTFWARVASLVAVVMALAGCRTDGKPRTELTTAVPLWEKDMRLYSVQSVSMGDMVFLRGSNVDADTQLTALDAITGDIRWELKSPEVGTVPGVLGRTGNALVMAWQDFGTMHILGVDAATGATLWKQEIPRAQPSYIYTLPMLDGEQVVLRDGYTSFVVFNGATGAEQWRVSLERPHFFDESRPPGVHTIKSFTAIAGGKVHYLTSDGMWGTIDFIARTTTETPLTFTKPADLLLGERTIILYTLSPQTMAFNMGDTLIGIDTATLTEIWRVSGFLTNRIQHIHNGVFYINAYRAYDERTGHIVWERPQGGAIRGAGTAQFSDATETILDLDRDGLGVEAFAMATGEPLWTVTLPDIAPNSHYTDLFTAGNAVVVGVRECGDPGLDPCPEVESSVFAYDLTTQTLLWRYTGKEAFIVGMDEQVVVINADGKKLGVGVP